MDSFHEVQIAHNRRLLERISTPAHDHLDWEITIMFYIILHMVDYYCVRNGLAEASNHKERNLVVEEKMPQIHQKYRLLLGLSIQARYSKGYMMTKDELDIANGLYKDLVAFLSSD